MGKILFKRAYHSYPPISPFIKRGTKGLAIASLSLAMTGKEIGGAYGTLRGY